MGRYFGTDGFRGEAGVTLLDSHAYRIGRFLGQYPNGKKNRILISMDTRVSGLMFLESLSQGITDSGSDVFSFGVSTTPSLSYLTQSEGFDYAIMISASHNPYQDNGIKVFNSKGEKLESEIESLIEDYIDSEEDYLPFRKEDGHLKIDISLQKKYIDWLCSKVEGDLSSLKVIVDCANGSACSVAPALLKRLGVNATFINSVPNGKNINLNCGSTHLEGLIKVFNEGDYDLGLAFDGDADRFMGIAPDGRIIDGDALIFLSALSMKKKGTLNKDSVVITVMSNLGLRIALKENGISFETVSVGDKYVQAKLKEEKLSLGGEQSGHVIFLDELNTGDGMLSAIKLMNIFINEKDVFSKLDECKVYPQLLKNIRFKSREELDEIENSPELAILIKDVESSFKHNGRVLVRASGTEPLIRVMVEDEDKEECVESCMRIYDWIQRRCD